MTQGVPTVILENCWASPQRWFLGSYRRDNHDLRRESM